MEKMPYQPDLDRPMSTATATISSDWRTALPVMVGEKVTLRELEVSDAPALFAMLTPEEVSRFISPPPTTVEGFEKFITWALTERAAGRYATARTRVCDGGMGLRDWIRVLGNRDVPRRRPDGRKLRD